MASIEFRVKVIKSSDGTTATLAEVDGSIDASTIQQFQQVMDKLVEKGVKNLILDCANVKYINSSGLGTLLRYSDSFESIGGHIAFCRVPSKVMLVMEMLGFNALFNVVTDEATALRSFSGRLAPPSSISVRTSVAPKPPASQPAAVAAPPAPPAAVAPAPAAAFPIQSACARCRVVLTIPAPGHFKCPRCGTVLSVETNGRVRFYALKKSCPVAIKLPCKFDVAVGAAELAGKCAAGIGFNGNSVGTISQAVAAACKNVIERAYNNDVNRAFDMLISATDKALTVKIADHGKPFDFGPGGTIQADSRFAPVVEVMDTVEHRPNPKGGNLLTLIKVLQQAE